MQSVREQWPQGSFSHRAHIKSKTLFFKLKITLANRLIEVQNAFWWLKCMWFLSLEVLRPGVVMLPCNSSAQRLRQEDHESRTRWGSVVKALAKACRPEFSHRFTTVEGENRLPSNCPLIATCAWWHSYTHVHMYAHSHLLHISNAIKMLKKRVQKKPGLKFHCL